MIVGILSDTHGRVEMAQRAVRMLVENGAEFLIHCGDVGESDVLDTMAGHQGIFVFGNNDYERGSLEKYAATIGITCGGTCGEIDLDGKKVIVTHGDDRRLMNRVIREQKIDYLFLGHTHETMDQHEGKIRLINPGALYRAAVKTVALLDTAKDELRFIRIPG